MGITEEPTAARAEESEQSVQDVINLTVVGQDPARDAAVEDAVLDAFAQLVGRAQDNVETPTAPTFLTSVSVVGFRRIERQARLDWYGLLP